MSLRSRAAAPVPEETAAVARAAFPKGATAIRVRDALDPIYDDEAFAPLFSSRGRPAESPGRLALVSVLRFAEGLSDRQAAEAVRARIDRKYALGLELTDPGFDFSILSEFRARLVAGAAEQHVLDAILARAAEVGLLKARAKQRTDSSHVLSAARALNRLEGVGETLCAALNALATVAPDWLAVRAPTGWFDRDGARFGDARLPKGDAARNALAATVGADGFALLTAVHAADAPPWLRELPAVEVLRRAWVHQFLVADGEVRWRPVGDLAPSRLRSDTPYDPEARYADKGATAWTGYKVHLTEVCDDDAPHLVTHAATTPAPAADVTTTARVHADLAAKGFLPAGHWVDANYVDAGLLVASQHEHGVELVGPVRPDTSWQAKAAAGYDVSRFAIDWDARTATCPEGATSVRWQPVRSPWGTPLVHVEFSNRDCRPCPARASCTRSKTMPRELTLRRRAEHEALQGARVRQTTAEWKDRYAGGRASKGRSRKACGPSAAPVARRRAPEDAPAARTHRGRHEPRPGRRLAGRDALRQDAHLPLRRPAPRRRVAGARPLDSPTASPATGTPITESGPEPDQADTLREPCFQHSRPSWSSSTSPSERETSWWVQRSPMA